VVIKEITQALLDASKEVSLEANTEKTKCIFLSRLQNAEQNHYLIMCNKSFESVSKFKYSGTRVMTWNYTEE